MSQLINLLGWAGFTFLWLKTNLIFSTVFLSAIDEALEDIKERAIAVYEAENECGGEDESGDESKD